jgi:hypothetical protein
MHSYINVILSCGLECYLNYETVPVNPNKTEFLILISLQKTHQSLSVSIHIDLNAFHFVQIPPGCHHNVTPSDEAKNFFSYLECDINTMGSKV